MMVENNHDMGFAIEYINVCRDGGFYATQWWWDRVELRRGAGSPI